MTITRTNRQSIFDVALQYCGDAQAAFEIVDMNNLSLTDTETPEIEISEAYNKRVVDYYQINGVKPATAVNTTVNNIITNDDTSVLVTNNNNNIQIITNNE